MEDEYKKFSWTNFFIKGIIVIIFVLFTVWLLSLSNKGISNSLDVLTDNIFADNVDRMKDAAIGYYTNERLPQKIGGVATISLEDMYKEKLVLEIKDKHGNACSAKNSYVSVEKFNGYEYHMKVYLECGEEHDYINVILGCYDYCDSEVCEKEDTKQLEYEYSKTSGGHWTDYGKWSEWSKAVITKTDYRDVETKTVSESYGYDKNVTKNEYISFEVSCPSGYYRDGDKCYKEVNKITYVSPNKCPVEYNGYKLVSQEGFTCNYSREDTVYTDPNKCPAEYNGYKLVSQEGFTCNYSKTTSNTANPICPSGYNRNGFTCTKSVSSAYYENPVCSNGHYRDGWGCYYTYYEKHWVEDPRTGISVQQNIPKRGYGGAAQCPSGTSRSGNSCVGYTNSTDTKTAVCPSGYSKSGNNCVKTDSSSITSVVGCPSGYNKSGNSCVGTKTTYTSKNTVCPTGYDKAGNKCYKDVSEIVSEDLNKTCPSGYKKTSDGTKCYKEVTSVEHATGTRNVTYYRYRLREFAGGTVDYKWSTSNNDKKLLEAGYKLTGRTREIGGK